MAFNSNFNQNKKALSTDITAFRAHHLKLTDRPFHLV